MVGGVEQDYGGYYEWVVPTTGIPNTLSARNPLGLIEQKEDASNVHRFIGNLKIDYDVHGVEGLTGTLNLGMDVARSNGTVFIPATAASAFTQGGVDNTYEQEKENKLLEAYLNYHRTFGTSKFDLTGGYTYQNWHTFSPSMPNISATGDTITPAGIDFETENTLLSFFGRLNYTYDERFLLTATLRNDGSSRFSSDEITYVDENGDAFTDVPRWGLFPSVAVAWRLSQEQFLANCEKLTNLKLRFGWGVTGQQDIFNDYPYIPNFSEGTVTAQYQFGNEFVTVLRPDGYDAGIRWEETTSLNIGADFGFVDNRYGGTIDVYKKTTDDLLAVVPVPAGTNFTNQILTNVGSMENEGIELGLYAIPIAKDDIYFEIGGNVSANRNEITKLSLIDDPDDPGILVGGISGGVGNTIQIHSVGYATNSFYMTAATVRGRHAAGRPVRGCERRRYGEPGRPGPLRESDSGRLRRPLCQPADQGLVVRHLDPGGVRRGAVQQRQLEPVVLQLGHRRGEHAFEPRHRIQRDDVLDGAVPERPLHRGRHLRANGQHLGGLRFRRPVRRRNQLHGHRDRAERFPPHGLLRTRPGDRRRHRQHDLSPPAHLFPQPQHQPLIMKLRIALSAALLSLLSFPLGSCFQDLDTQPFAGINAETVYSDPANYINVLAKLYAGLATTGNQGPAGSGDIAGIDEGFSSYLRILWNLQTVTTDEAVVGWADPDLPELNFMDISSINSWVLGMYYRIFFQITLCNDFIRNASDDKLADRGFSQADIDLIRGYRAEARFLRALSYYHALDLFGNVPFVTEDDAPGAFFPEQIFRADLFDYVESELLAAADGMADPMGQVYGRADKAAVWMTLARLYLNAEVYLGAGNGRYDECLTYTNMVIAQGYTLEPTYEYLFLADNHLSSGVIFPVTFDGNMTQTWGGTTFLVHAPVGGSMDPAEFGINNGWAGLRATPSLVNQWGDTVSGPDDSRFMFYRDGQDFDIEQLFTFTQGWAVTKWKNVDRDGNPGSHGPGDHVDTDFPFYRLAEAYLIYGEAVLRGGAGGDVGTATGYFNMLRERAYGDASANVATIDLDLILSERSRELYWEGQRRTDLIRYGLFTGADYVWEFKGTNDPADPNGVALEPHKDLFPLPAADLVANQNLQQNPGY